MSCRVIRLVGGEFSKEVSNEVVCLTSKCKCALPTDYEQHNYAPRRT